MKWMILLAAALSLAITACSGFVFVPWLHKIKCGQPIKEIGPTWHKKKSGTPTMGGIMFISGVLVSMTVLALLVTQRYPDLTPDLPETAVATRRLILGIAAALLFSAVGFIDDYLKVVRHNNAGLRGWYKIFLQVAIAGAYLASLAIWGGQTTTAFFPFLGTADLGIFYWVLSMLMIVGVVNAVNLTDGLDGLNSSVTAVASVSLTVIAVLRGQFGFSLFAAAVAGGCIGFLFWNFYPAKVMMGDTGSMFLGGAVIALAYGLDLPVILVFVGIIYFCEAASDVLQVCYFKLTHGKRIFKMAPIHHHFEMCGLNEIQIGCLFCAVGVIGGVLAIVSVA